MIASPVFSAKKSQATNPFVIERKPAQHPVDSNNINNAESRSAAQGDPLIISRIKPFPLSNSNNDVENFPTQDTNNENHIQKISPTPQKYEKYQTKNYSRNPRWMYFSAHGLDVIRGSRVIESIDGDGVIESKNENYMIHRYKTVDGRWSEAVLIDTPSVPTDCENYQQYQKILKDEHFGFTNNEFGYPKALLVRYIDSNGLTFGTQKFDDKFVEKIIENQKIIAHNELSLLEAKRYEELKKAEDRTPRKKKQAKKPKSLKI